MTDLKNLEKDVPFSAVEEGGWICIKSFGVDLSSLEALLKKYTKAIKNKGLIIQIWKKEENLLICRRTPVFFSSDSVKLLLHRLQSTWGSYDGDHILSEALKNRECMLVKNVGELDSMPVVRNSAIIASAYLPVCESESEEDASMLLEVSALSVSDWLEAISKISAGLAADGYWVPPVDLQALSNADTESTTKKVVRKVLTKEYLTNSKLSVKQIQEETGYCESSIRKAFKNLGVPLPSIQELDSVSFAEYLAKKTATVNFIVSYPADMRHKADPKVKDDIAEVKYTNLHANAHRGRFKRLQMEIERVFGHQENSYRLKYAKGGRLLLMGNRQVQKAIDYALENKSAEVQVFLYPNSFYQDKQEAEKGDTVGSDEAAGGNTVGGGHEAAGGNTVGNEEAVSGGPEAAG